MRRPEEEGAGVAHRSPKKFSPAGRRSDFGNVGAAMGGQCQDMDKALFRKEFLEDMAPTLHRQSKRDGVVLGFAKQRARLMKEAWTATHCRSRTAARR